MQVTVLGKVIEADILDVVRLVASVHGVVDVDLEPQEGTKVTLKYGGTSISGKTKEAACEEFLKRVLK